MIRKIIWMVGSGGMVAALLLSACAPAVVEEEKVVPKEEVVTPKEEVVPKEVVVPKGEGNLVKWTATKRDGTVVEKMLEKPRYGGEFIFTNDVEPSVFDSILDASTWASEPVLERLAIQHDWMRGPAGTGELDMMLHIDSPFSFTPMLATGYEIPDDQTIIYHIRQGVYWQDKPPMNGRLFTAEDVVSDYIRLFGPGTYGRGRGPLLSDPDKPQNSISVSPTNKWDVIVKTQPGTVPAVFMAMGCHRQIHPPEVTQKYGDMNDWKNVVGTGAYILKDYVSASSLTYVRNPNYWGNDPFFPENRLPYVDTVKVLIIPDSSTQQAALRTGKIDTLLNLDPDEAGPLLKSSPELKWVKHVGEAQLTLNMRNDKPEQPWYDVRVRRALAMAINHFELRDVYYKGDAGLLQWPAYPVAEWADVYMPFEELPASAKELFEYHPDRAKALLAEAGYPQGFKAEVLVASAPAERIELLQIIKEYWAKIGVDLKIDVQSPTVVASTTRFKRQKEMYMATMTSASIYQMTYFRKGSGPNNSLVEDPKMEALYVELIKTMPDPKWRQMLREVIPYIYEQAWFMLLPSPNQYNLWQPWLKNFEGANRSHVATFWWPQYIWIDQEMKAAMGH
ncbi:MAG: ABC transporter substrate-binding protein [Chloroflexi bacterium]|nr:ABC transporter substrate-binding protein [Chloroflexota bacterium]